MQQPRNIYHVMRHGHSEANAAGIIVSGPGTGVSGYGLSARGLDEVRRALREQSVLSSDCRIVSSDFLRARQSAELVHNSLQCNFPVRCDERLRERWFGNHDGGSADAYPRVWEQDVLDPGHRRENVESVNDVHERVTRLLMDLESEASGENFLLVAHGDVLQILLAVCAGRPASEHRSITHLETAEIRSVVFG